MPGHAGTARRIGPEQLPGSAVKLQLQAAACESAIEKPILHATAITVTLILHSAAKTKQNQVTNEQSRVSSIMQKFQQLQQVSAAGQSPT
jgi:hypothetical protein